MTQITVREYAKLYRGEQSKNIDLASATLSKRDFDWLVKQIESNDDEEKGWRQFLRFHKHDVLSVRQFVGYIETPYGLGIEILPKHTADNDDKDENGKAQSRDLLLRMLASYLNVKPIETAEAHLQTNNTPIHEWIFSRFLAEVSALLFKGIRSDYEQFEEETRFIRGRLLVKKQLHNQLRVKLDRFHIEHDIYTPNRLENRLLATALRRVQASTKQRDNQRLANRLNHIFAELPSEYTPQRVWSGWRNSRLLQHYQHVKPWCKLILFGQNPEFMTGDYRGIALLFDMNKLFESYVANQLREQGLKVEEQIAKKYLVNWQEQDNRACFGLKPDLCLRQHNKDENEIIADCKWKLLSQNQTGDRYQSPLNLSQADMYQMQAYAVHYLPNGGNLMLIYPKYSDFENKQTMKFNNSDSMNRNWTLHIMPFDLHKTTDITEYKALFVEVQT